MLPSSARRRQPTSRRAAVLLLAALMAAFALPSFAVAASAPAPATAADASFVASLAAPAAPASPAPIFLQTSTDCTSDAQCPPGKLCCRACAFPGCTHKACLTPMNGHCPLIP